MRSAQELLKAGVRFVDSHSPVILTSFAAVGVVSTTVLAVRATPEALRRISIEEDNREQDYVSGSGKEPLDLTKFEVVKLAWRPYLPAGLMGTATIAAIIGARTIDSKRNAAWAAAYSLSERAYHEYRERTREEIGETKEEKIRSDVAQRRLAQEESDNDGNREVIILGNGEVLCFETSSGRAFMSDKETIRRAVNDINAEINHHGFATLSDFYRKIGLPVTSMSEEMGWNTHATLEVLFSGFVTADDRPALALDYAESPIMNPHKDPWSG